MSKYTVNDLNLIIGPLGRPVGCATLVANELNRLLAQRDALLEACERAEGWLNDSDVAYVISHDKGEQADYCNLMVSIRAAIKEASK